MYNEPRLIDKVALVFGGSRGIGAAIVRRLAATSLRWNGCSVLDIFPVGCL
jgi:NAD(P)-dependent dehydrogenase (short-subunit alcohol dehydrogenase family)